MQWHPERPQYEWVPGLGINHSIEAIVAMQYMADFIGNATRARFEVSVCSHLTCSNRTFPSDHERADALIYNYPLLVDPEHDSHQSWFFPPASQMN